MPYVRITRLDNTVVPGDSINLAVGHDLACMKTPSVPNPHVATENAEADARIGDEVVVLGNSEGSRVIQPLAGKIVGIGPDRIEVSAEFVPGNSGSPIIHVKSGRVIAVATYLTKRRFTEWTEETKSKVRRFGYRIDSVKKWQPIVWNVFQAENAAIEKVRERTHEFEQLFRAIEEGKSVNADAFSTAISRPVRDFVTAVGRGNVSEPDRKYAFRSLLTSLRSVSRSDILQTRERLRYDYFQRAVSEEAETREQIYKIFDNSVKAN